MNTELLNRCPKFTLLEAVQPKLRAMNFAGALPLASLLLRCRQLRYLCVFASFPARWSCRVVIPACCCQFSYFKTFDRYSMAGKCASFQAESTDVRPGVKVFSLESSRSKFMVFNAVSTSALAARKRLVPWVGHVLMFRDGFSLSAETVSIITLLVTSIGGGLSKGFIVLLLSVMRSSNMVRLRFEIALGRTYLG